MNTIDNILEDVERGLQGLYKEAIAAPSIPIEAESDGQYKSNSNLIAHENVSLATLILDMYWEVRWPGPPRQAAT